MTYPGDLSLGTALSRPDFTVKHELQKDAVRLAVADFMQEHQKLDVMRLFTLPGLYWRFEAEMLRRWRKPARIIAVERSWNILQAGAISMPGADRRYHQEKFAGNEYLGYSTDHSSVLCATASAFIAPNRRLIQSNSAARRWNSAYCRWTGAWLDLCTPLNYEVLACLRGVAQNIHPRVRYFPFSLTLCVGRESLEGQPLVAAQVMRTQNKSEQRALAVVRYFNRHARTHVMALENYQAYKVHHSGKQTGQAMMVMNALITPR